MADMMLAAASLAAGDLKFAPARRDPSRQRPRPSFGEQRAHAADVMPKRVSTPSRGSGHILVGHRSGRRKRGIWVRIMPPPLASPSNMTQW